jgi:hypothetical protein
MSPTHIPAATDQPVPETPVFMVFWMEREEGGAMMPRSCAFGARGMVDALAFMEALRARERGGEPIRHVTMSSDMPENVGLRGVDVVGVGYSWTKRRSNDRRRR